MRFVISGVTVPVVVPVVVAPDQSPIVGAQSPPLGTPSLMPPAVNDADPSCVASGPPSADAVRLYCSSDVNDCVTLPSVAESSEVPANVLERFLLPVAWDPTRARGPANVLVSSVDDTSSDAGTAPAALGQPSSSPAITARRVSVITGEPVAVSVTLVWISVSSSTLTSEPANDTSMTVCSCETAVMPPPAWLAVVTPRSSW